MKAPNSRFYKDTKRIKVMTILEKAVSTIQQLPIEKQQEALNFIEFLVFKLRDRHIEKVDELSLVEDKLAVSCYDLTKKWIGIVDDLPEDLPVNRKYMKGYGAQEFRM